jgi:hypothetical protein
VALARVEGDDAFVGRALDHRACAEMFRRPGDAPPLLDVPLSSLGMGAAPPTLTLTVSTVTALVSLR